MLASSNIELVRLLMKLTCPIVATFCETHIIFPLKAATGLGSL